MTKRIIDKLLPVTLLFAQAQIDAGADCILVADHSTSDLCSPQAYKDFLQPIHTEIKSKLGVPVLLHICGNTSDRIHYINETGMDCFHWDTKSGPASFVRRKTGDRMALMGGVGNKTLLHGTKQDVQTEVSAALKAGIDIIGPECAIPLKTPLVNLLAIKERVDNLN